MPTHRSNFSTKNFENSKTKSVCVRPRLNFEEKITKIQNWFRYAGILTNFKSNYRFEVWQRKHSDVKYLESNFSKLGSANTRYIERPGALIQSINRMQPAMMMSPDVYDYYDVWKWRNRLTLGLNVAENTNYMKKSFK